MKRNMLAIISAIALFTGCATTPEQDLKNIVADARDIGEFGTRVALLENSNNRLPLEFTLVGLKELEALPDPLTVDALVGVLGRLPVSELQTEKAQLYILGGKAIIRRATGNIQIGTLGLRPIVTALREGMEAGLSR